MSKIEALIEKSILLLAISADIKALKVELKLEIAEGSKQVCMGYNVIHAKSSERKVQNHKQNVIDLQDFAKIPQAKVDEIVNRNVSVSKVEGSIKLLKLKIK